MADSNPNQEMLLYRPYYNLTVAARIYAVPTGLFLFLLGGGCLSYTSSNRKFVWGCFVLFLLCLGVSRLLWTVGSFMAVIGDSGIRITGLKKNQDVYYPWEALPYVYWTANYKGWEYFVLAERPLTDREVRRAANKLERFKNFRSGIITMPLDERVPEIKEILRRHVREERNVTHL